MQMAHEPRLPGTPPPPFWPVANNPSTLDWVAEKCPTCQTLEQEIVLARHDLAHAGRDVPPMQSIADNDLERELARWLSSTHEPDAAAGFRAADGAWVIYPRHGSANGSTRRYATSLLAIHWMMGNRCTPWTPASGHAMTLRRARPADITSPPPVIRPASRS